MKRKTNEEKIGMQEVVNEAARLERHKRMEGTAMKGWFKCNECDCIWYETPQKDAEGNPQYPLRSNEGCPKCRLEEKKLGGEKVV